MILQVLIGCLLLVTSLPCLMSAMCLLLRLFPERLVNKQQIFEVEGRIAIDGATGL